jgi:hypothetical protein
MAGYLTHGLIAATAPSEAEAKTAYRAHRTEVLAEELGPGRRAFGFMTFDLGATPGRALDDIGSLMERGLIDATESIGVEKSYRILDSDVPPEFCKNFSSIERIADQKLSARTVERYAKNFAIAARWHRWRGRAEIAARFEKYALACEAWLASLN